MNTKRNLLIFSIIIIFLGAIGADFYFFKKIAPKQNGYAWPPKIDIRDAYYKDWEDYRNKKENNTLDQKIIKKGNDYISNKIGEEFFSKYVKLIYSSDSGSWIRLEYIVVIPEKNIDFKTTTEPVEINLYLNKDLSLAKPEQIANLPDCRNIKRCLSFADRQKAIDTVIADIEKSNYKKAVNEISLDWMFSSAEHPMLWYVYYSLPDEAIECESYGGSVHLIYDAFNDKVVKREKNCIEPGY